MVVIVGAGLIGLSIAYELAKRGAEVRVVETRECTESPSWAGAGKLAPFTDSDGSEEQEQFLAAALGVYQVFVKEIHKRTGVDPYLRIDGIIQVAHDPDAARALRARADVLVDRGVHAHWLEPDEARRLEPALGPATFGASLVEEEGHIDPRQLGQALRLACVDVGVQLEDRAGDVALEIDEGRAVGVRAGDAVVKAEAIVNATGAWAGRLGGVPQQVEIPVAPVPVQLLSVTMPPRFVLRVLTVPGAYLIPRFDGTLLIGEAEHEPGFDARVDPAATRRLYDAAVRAVPALAELTVDASWTGLRPRTPNGRPFIGTTALEGYFVAAGHDRNAILLAPATALALANIIEENV